MDMWSIGSEDSSASGAAARPDCPGCGEPDPHGDDFCHECGHSFAHFSNVDGDVDDAESGLPCPMCASGQLSTLEYGRTQCDACGYTVRDEG